MVAASDQSQQDRSSYLHNILEAPEHPDLRRMTALVEHVFHVPVAYMALLGTGDTIVARVGNGTEYGARLGAVHLDRLLSAPHLVRDAACDLPPGTDLADLRFVASALLRSTSGVQFGVLVIADRVPRPEFSATDLRDLADLAGILAAKMELRMIASLALEAELSLRENEQTIHGIAGYAPVPLIYCRADGACVFVNQAWLDFSGRRLEQELASGWISLIHAEYRRAVVEECWRAFEAQLPFTAEAPLRRHDGKYRWMLSKGAPRFRGDGSFAGHVACLIDVADYRGEAGALTCGLGSCPCGRSCPLPCN
jgi:PAS domain S-box-containing protein